MKSPSGGTRASWRCPTCGRRFAKRNQAHSCQARTVASHFRGRSPQLRAAFDSLCQALKRTGPLRVDAVKSGISLASEHHFAGVLVRKDHLRVGFLGDHEIQSKRLFAILRVGPHRVEYHVAVSSPADVDAELLGWLAEAQALQARRR